MEKDIAQFRFLGYRILKSNIEISDTMPISPELEVHFEQTSCVNEEERHFSHTMTANICDKNMGLKINVTLIGNFEFDTNLTEEQKENFFCVNAPSLLFPYVRAYITSLTALSGIAPIILPTLNMTRNKNNEGERKL